MVSQYIVIEGLEGSGKSTAIEMIKRWLVQRGIKNIITTREPGGTPIAEALRHILKMKYPDDTMDNMTELLLMYAARVQLVNTVIKPALQQGTWVIGDRHELSTRAYQGGGRGFDISTMETLWKITLQGFQPNLTLYLDLDPVIGLERVLQRGVKDRIEEEAIEFFQRVRAVYRDCVARNSNVYQIDAHDSLERVHQNICNILEQKLNFNYEQ